MHKPQPYTGNDRHDDAGEHVDPGWSRVAGEPDDLRHTATQTPSMRLTHSSHSANVAIATAAIAMPIIPLALSPLALCATSQIQPVGAKPLRPP
jgi:hypothetical protein